MRLPTFANLHAMTDPTQTMIWFAAGPRFLQGNPRHYKFLWQVFSPESPWEGHAFMEQAPLLCNAAFEKEIERLQEQGMSCLVYGYRRPRLDPSNPWDLNSSRWKGERFAPSWDDDLDPIFSRGHK